MQLIKMRHILIAFLFLVLANNNNITGNLPTIVTQMKNYTSASPRWVTSPYFRAGNEQVIKDFTGSNQYPFASYTFTYSSALPGVPNLAYGIQRYRGNDYLGQEYYEIRQTALTASTFSVQIQIFGVTNLWILAVAYIAVDPTFPHHLNSFDNVPINYTAGNIVNISSKSSSLSYYTNYIDYSQQAAGRAFTQFTSPYSSNYIVIYMTSLWIAGSFGTLVQFHIYPQVVNSTHYMWNITLYKSVLVTNVHFSEIIFNSDDVESSQKYFIVLQKWYNDKNGGFLAIPIQFKDNFIMGVTSFQCTDAACGFEYQWQFVNKTINGVQTFGVEMLLSWTVNNRCGFSWSESYIFYMMTWRCISPYVYFNMSTGYCQTACGGFSIENQVTGVCQLCSNKKCYQCDNSTTNQCSYCASYLFYELSPSGSCVCMPRYMTANDSCIHCSYGSTGCIDCTYDDGNSGLSAYNPSLFACTECNNTQNYFLTGPVCTLCTLGHCTYCQNLTACAVCEPTYDYSDIQTCMHCLVTGCLNCSHTDDNVCIHCNNTGGYYNNATNQQCYTICGDGIYVSATEGCDDGNNIDYDGCAANCTVESAFGCSGSPSQCYFASNVVLTVENQIKQSQICNTVTFQFRFSPPSDTFAQSYVNWDSFLNSPNDSILIPNHTMTSYSAGILSISYFLLNHLQNETLIFQTNFPTLIANTSILNFTISDPINFTVHTTPQALMICCRGYYMAYDPLRCQEICGDAILFILPCDDGNLIDFDGCSSECEIQQYYQCINGTDFTPSVCSYGGPFEITLDTAYKEPTRNSVNLTYVIYPTYPFLVINAYSTDFLQMVSYPGRDIAINSATFDLQTSSLTLQIDYNQNLQDTGLKLQINPLSVPRAYMMGTQGLTWKVQSTNQLAVVAYTLEDYAKLEQLAVLANSLLGSFISLTCLTLIFRKFIGLELATLYQIGYLSLLQNTQITTYQQPISNWKYVFGYNHLIFSPLPSERFGSPYAILGYQSYFGYSNNAMIIAAGGVYAISVILLVISTVSTKATSRRFKNAAFIVASELGYGLVVFLTPSIVTALCIEAKEGIILDASIFWSKAMLVGGVFMLLITHFLNLSTVEQNPDIGTYLRKHSKFGIYMPILFSIRLVLLTTLLFVYHTTPTLPSYLIIITQLTYLIFILFGRPHKKPFDLFRAIIIEVFLLYILVMRFVETKALANYVQYDSFLYPLMAYIEYACYAFGTAVSYVGMIYHIVKRVKGKKIQNTYRAEQEQVPKIPEPRRILNESSAKLDQQSSKRQKNEGNPAVFDLQQINQINEDTVQQTTLISLDSKSSSPRPRRNRSKRWQ